MLPAGRYLVATRTCPNCKHAAAQMDQAGIAYEELLAEENVELAQRFRIMQAPTLLEVAADGTVGITAGAAAVFQKINALQSPGGGVRALVIPAASPAGSTNGRTASMHRASATQAASAHLRGRIERPAPHRVWG